MFSLGGEEYALPITRVQESIRQAEPRSPATRSGAASKSVIVEAGPGAGADCIEVIAA